MARTHGSGGGDARSAGSLDASYTVRGGRKDDLTGTASDCQTWGGDSFRGAGRPRKGSQRAGQGTRHESAKITSWAGLLWCEGRRGAGTDTHRTPMHGMSPRGGGGPPLSPRATAPPQPRQWSWGSSDEPWFAKACGGSMGVRLPGLGVCIAGAWAGAGMAGAGACVCMAGAGAGVCMAGAGAGLAGDLP